MSEKYSKIGSLTKDSPPSTPLSSSQFANSDVMDADIPNRFTSYSSNTHINFSNFAPQIWWPYTSHMNDLITIGAAKDRIADFRIKYTN